jgi:diguanylate cyclase (GGDEF)-like protein
MHHERIRLRRVRAYVGVVALLACLAVWELVRTAGGLVPDQHYVFAVVLFSVLLFLGETQSKLWMRWGDQGLVTPGWAFAYALVLMGTPVGAVVMMVLTNLYIDARHQKGALKLIFNTSQVALALSVGGLILRAFGLRNGMAGIDHLPWQQAIGILLAGAATFAVNALLIVVVICLHTGTRPGAVMERSYLLSIAADAALLALAPVFVIAIDYSTLMLPLLGITSFLVYHSARNALRSEHAANHDPLTMLLNRRAFDEALTKAVEETAGDRQTLVLVMDLDRFKDINDRLGHPIGDRLLRSFADRLERVLPSGASSSRLGGDEFAVVLPDVDGAEAATQLVARWHAALSEPHDLSGFPVTSAVSIGAAIAPEHGQSANALMAAADVAMYRAKQFQTGVEFATTADGIHDVGRVGLLTDLREAIGTPQLFAHYQPLVRLDTGVIESVEALIRWVHPVHGNIAPVDFIGMTEHTDLIGPLTEGMFRSAMTEVLSLGTPMPRLCINVAARNLTDRQFAATVVRIMQEVGFSPDQLEIEIIERDIVTTSEKSLLALATLRNAGVRVAIDDFGTGYSSFSTLRELTVDRLKIDQQFTRNIMDSWADEMIVTKLVEIAHALNLDVVAEGVESYEVWDRLAQLGCDVAQGYAIARPMPLNELRAWMRTQHQAPMAPPLAPPHSLPTGPTRLQVVAS